MKKYSSLHPSLIERICHEERESKNPGKAVKTRLHQLYGAYVQPNSNKKASALITQLADMSGTFISCPLKKSLAAEESDSFHKLIIGLLKLHASTSERLPYYNDFYDFVFSRTGAVNKVLDLGCGYNPFSLPFFPRLPIEYHAVDVDIHTKDLLNVFFELVHLPKYAKCADLGTVTPSVEVDLTLMLKLFPVLEANNPGRAYSLANKLNTNWLVITFPTKSLSGKKKGMAINYKASFEDAISKNALSNFNLSAESSIGNELIFLLRHDSI